MASVTTAVFRATGSVIRIAVAGSAIRVAVAGSAIRVAVSGSVLLVAVLVQAAPPSAAVDAAELTRPEEGEILRLYRAVLDREPDQGGFDYWVAARIEGVPLRAVADGFLNSREFRRRFGSGTDGEFVDRAYGNVLGRPGDPDGRSYWLGQLSDGLARTELVLLFSESIEHRNRTGTTLAELPPFRPAVSTISRSDLGQSWRPGCPVDPDRLRAVELDHVAFDGRHARGTVVVHADAVEDVITVFTRLYEARYPIASITPIDAFAGDDDASMEANNTSAFNCRAVTGGRSWSRHAFGTAIDINPAQNPYVAGAVVLPAAGADVVDRSVYHPAMIRPGDVVTAAFDNVGWSWGGDFRSLKDYQHFEG